MSRLYILLFLLLMLSGCKEAHYFDALNDELFGIKPKISAQEKSKPQTLERHKIAVLVPLTGHASEIGRGISDAAALAAKETGDSGFDVVIYDTANTQAAAQKAAKQAIAENAQIILGPLFGAQAKVVGQIAKERNVKVISFSNDKNIAGNGVYIMGLMPDQQIHQLLKFVSTDGAEGVSAIIPNGQFGDEVKSAIQKFAPTYRINLHAITTYNQTEKSFEAQADAVKKQLKQDDLSQVIIIPEGGEKLDRIINALRKKGITTKNTRILGTNMWDNYEVNHISGLEGAWFSSIPRNKFTDFSARFKNAYGYDPDLIFALGYDSVRLAISLSGSKFSKEALTSQSGFGGVNGIFRFVPNGTNERLFEIRKVSEWENKVSFPSGDKF